jgi:hypothetical protein
MCAREAWTAASIGDRWGDLELVSYVAEGNDSEVLYQQGKCSSLVSPPELLANLPFARPRCFAMLTGTVPVEGGVRPAPRFRAELHDRATNRAIAFGYRIDALDGVPTHRAGSEV